MRTAYLCVILAFLLWGSTGLFVRWAGLPSEVIVFYRVIFSFLLLGLILVVQRARFQLTSRKLVFFSGVALALNWIFFFKAIQTTSIANAVLSYYLAPIFVTLLSPFVTHEKWEKSTWIALAMAVAGILFMLGFSGNSFHFSDIKGIFFGITAAFFYSLVTLSGKKIQGLSAIQLVFWQTGVSALLLSPYGLHAGWVGGMSLAILFILGAVHTAFALVIYFHGLRQIKVQHIGVLAYLDPVSAVLFSWLFIGEAPDASVWIGGILILVGSFLIIRQEWKRDLSRETASE